jgi:serine/threonine protein kinase
LESLHVVESAARGLQFLHGAGCVHRDIKPDNILYFGDRIALGDLGIVKWSDLNPAFTSAGTITKAAVQLGSWFYMAHEQRQKPHEAVAHSDIYSLGVSWYEMLTGTTPDPGAVGAEAFDDPTANIDVTALIRRMLRFKPQDRPDAAEILRGIDTIRASGAS